MRMIGLKIADMMREDTANKVTKAPQIYP